MICVVRRDSGHTEPFVRSVLISLVILTPVFAAGLEPGRTLTQALQRIWQAPQGLPEATIYSIRQTQDGYLWLGTQTGLVRFDGVRFKTVGDRAWITDLVEDGEHNLWAATNGSGLIRLRSGVTTRYSLPEGLPSDSVHSLFCDSRGALWVCTADGLAKFDAGKFQPYRTQQGLATTNIRAACEAKDGAIWVGGDGAQLSVWNGSEFKPHPLASIPADAGIRTILCGDDGTIWIGTPSGLGRLKDGAERRYTTKD